MSKINHALRAAITQCAAHAQGMKTSHVPGASSQSAYLCARRMESAGLLYRAPDGARDFRWFASSARRDAWAAANPPDRHMATARGPAAWRGTSSQPSSGVSVSGMESARFSYRAAPATARHATAADGAGARLPTTPPFVYRAGSQDHEQHPSRVGNRLIYRDGRVATLTQAG